MGLKLSEWRLKITDLGSSVLGEISHAGDEAAKKFTLATEKVHHFQSALHGVASEIPGLDAAFRFLENPVVLTTAGVVALGAAIYKATNFAGEFDDAFLKLEHLNQGKNIEQMEDLKSSILSTALAYKLKASTVADSYYKIQSLTAKEGAENLAIVGRVGQFARSVQADVTGLTTNVAKAMGIFHFGQEGIDKYLQSMGKLVQTSELTWEEANKGVIVFQSFAQAVNQSADSSFKLYAYLGKRAGDFSLAAYETRGVLESLVNPHIMKGLEKMGVNLYDASGKMKSLAEITNIFHGIFQKAGSDQAIDHLVAKLGRGAEGFKAYIGAIKTDYAGMMETFGEYDASKFDINKAIQKASGDFSQLKEIVGNQLNTIMIKFGEEILPSVARALAKVSTGLSWIGDHGQLIADVLKGIGVGAGVVGTALLLLNAPLIAATASVWAMNIALMFSPITWIVIGIGALIASVVVLWNRFEWFRGAITGTFEAIKQVFIGWFSLVKNSFSGLGDLLLGAITFNPAMMKKGLGELGNAFSQYGSSVAEKFHQGYNDGASKVHDRLANGHHENKAGESRVPGMKGNPSAIGAHAAKAGKANAAPTGVSGGSGGNKSIVIQKITLVEKMTINSGSVKESAKDIHRIVLETMTRALNGSEQLPS